MSDNNLTNRLRLDIVAADRVDAPVGPFQMHLVKAPQVEKDHEQLDSQRAA